MEVIMMNILMFSVTLMLSVLALCVTVGVLVGAFLGIRKFWRDCHDQSV